MRKKQPLFPKEKFPLINTEGIWEEEIAIKMFHYSDNYGRQDAPVGVKQRAGV